MLCEIAYTLFRDGDWYWYHLNIMCDEYGLNLYGERFKTPLPRKTNLAPIKSPYELWKEKQARHFTFFILWILWVTSGLSLLFGFMALLILHKFVFAGVFAALCGSLFFILGNKMLSINLK